MNIPKLSEKPPVLVPLPQPWLPAELHEFDGTVWRLVYRHGRLALLVRREVVWEGPTT